MQGLAVAAFGLAFVFMLSCGEHGLEEIFEDPSSDSNAEASSPSGRSSSSRSSKSSSSVQVFVFDENSQIYERDCHYDHYDEYADYVCDALAIPLIAGDIEAADGLRVGSVTNGIVSLQQPLPTISDKDLAYFLEEDEAAYYCTDYVQNIKVFYANFSLIGDEYTAGLDISNDDDSRGIEYWYFSKAGKISCDWKNDYSDYSSKKMNLDVNIGWNRIYYKYTIIDEDYNYTTEYTTSNTMTKPAKWFIRRQPNE